MKIKTNLNDYFLVKEKTTNKLFATLKSDTPLGKWKDLLDKSFTPLSRAQSKPYLHWSGLLEVIDLLSQAMKRAR